MRGHDIVMRGHADGFHAPWSQAGFVKYTPLWHQSAAAPTANAGAPPTPPPPVVTVQG
jgi:hypothetical protein